MPEEKKDKTTVLAKNANAELAVVHSYEGNKLCMHSKLHLDEKARMAASFAERWAMIMGEADGETSTGHPKMRKATAEEITKHACDVTEQLYTEFTQRGWVLDCPDWATLQGATPSPRGRNIED